jgi:3-carboxy-cis,cis-muconate cycloisomerase
MRANLDAAGGLPLAEHLAAELAASLGRLEAHDLVARASARAAELGITLPDALLSDQAAATALRNAGIGAVELAALVKPENYLGSAALFVRRALAAHQNLRERA